VSAVFNVLLTRRGHTVLFHGGFLFAQIDPNCRFVMNPVCVSFAIRWLRCDKSKAV
jgi:hypothetical protein